MKMRQPLQARIQSQAGFTLVELSIVLVIIGLIISSILVGQDLIRSAELRASVTQYEAFNAAVGTFRGKYGGLPGDIKGNTNFGFTPADGNADGKLIAVAAGGATTFAANENVAFWNNLGSSSAALIPGSYDGIALVSSTISGTLPATKAGNYWGVFAGPTTTTAEAVSGTSGSEAGTNYFLLGITGGTAGQANAATGASTLSPLEAKNIDDKIDDGKPSLGIVRARGTVTADSADQAPPGGTSTDPANCVLWVATGYTTAPTTNTYDIKGNAPTCTLRFKMVL